MHLYSSSEKCFGEVDRIGIALKAYAYPQNHAAILFLDHLDKDEPKLLHLSSHHNLKFDKPGDDYKWMELGSHFDQFNKEYLKAVASEVARVNDKVSGQYGLDVDTHSIDPITFKFVSSYKSKVGFTCATFILEVFQAAGFKLIDIATWPKDIATNIHWQRYTVLPHIEKTSTCADYVNLQNGNIGNQRLLPEELAASTQLKIPVSKSDVDKPAAVIVSKLRA